MTGTAPRARATRAGHRWPRACCCLYYRCPSGGLCGDCVFDRPPSRSSPREVSG
ncbi:(2Fe-2S)-binding protein [Streptomyces niveus]|uniref:(2Fe-2S)-binding protein n=1 Tax=Streptomyces niveus TaxID=193462 RepID=UPI003F4DFA1F